MLSWTSLILGTIAAMADVAGGLVLVRARGVERYLRYFVALGAGFLMATALLEMTPESLRLNATAGSGADHGRLLRDASYLNTRSTRIFTMARKHMAANSSPREQATRYWAA
jgi:hypothetical protein